MADELVRPASPVEFFKEQVEGAMARQHLHASDWTVYYLVNLLASYVSPARLDQMQAQEPLGLRLARALAAEGGPTRDDLRQIADNSLFLAGFFGDSLQRRLVDLDYYISLGGYAYSRLASHDDAFADVFGELAEKFVPVVDVLSDISDRSRSTQPRRPAPVRTVGAHWQRARPCPAGRKGPHGAWIPPDPVEPASPGRSRKNYPVTCVMIPAARFDVVFPPQSVDVPPLCNCPLQLTSGKIDAAEPY